MLKRNKERSKIKGLSKNERGQSEKKVASLKRKIFFYTNFIRGVSRTAKIYDGNAIFDDKKWKERVIKQIRHFSR